MGRDGFDLPVLAQNLVRSWWKEQRYLASVDNITQEGQDMKFWLVDFTAEIIVN
jgi:hypothetical protein